MKTFRVAADSSCLIGLAHIGQFELLKELFSEVYITEAVYEELKLDYALIDEKTARDTAELMDVDTMGIIRISDRLYKLMFLDLNE